VAITGRNEAALKAAGQSLGLQILLLHSDAGRFEGQAALARQLREHWPRLDAVFVNAGDVTHRPVEAWDEATYDQLMTTNLKGPFFLLQTLLPLLANPSSVILCGSVSAHIGLPQSGVCASGAAN
jgi:NAD(P)-dependent dehydrogenase (short-subunit alcohol dehydrogenase family)